MVNSNNIHAFCTEAALTTERPVGDNPTLAERCAR
jgi:hypothetical protein